MVPKHRRSDIAPSRASARAPAYTAEYWPEAVGYGPVTATAEPTDLHAESWHAGDGYDAGDGYPMSDGYYRAAAEPGWAVAAQRHSWEQWAVWEDGAPPPTLYPDHPSAPVPRVEFPADHPSRPMSALRPSGPPDLPRRRPEGSARAWNAPPQAPDVGYDNGNRRLHAVPNGPGPAITDWREPTEFHHERSTGWQETADYHGDTGPFAPDRGPEDGRFRSGRSAGTHSRWTAGQALMVADGRAAHIVQEAQDYAASMLETAEREAATITQQATGQAQAIREAAEREFAMEREAAERHAVTIREAAEREIATVREAAEREAATITKQATSQAEAIRDAAEREVAELRARLDSMTGELGRVAAYVTDSLTAPAMPATAPLPEAPPAPASTRPSPPATRPAKPATRPAGPRTAPTSQPHEPGTRTAKPGSAPRSRTATPGTAPRTGPAEPARQTATPTKPGQTQGRQRRAFRIATAGTAALLSIAAVGAVTMTGIHGFSFFVFREAGQGETPGNFKDSNFLARQAAAQHHDAAPKGRHHKATGSK